MRLLVVSHTPHYMRHDRFVGWGPTVRELSYLAEMFDELVHVAPLYGEPAPASAQPYESARVRVRPVPAAGGPRLSQKMDIVAQYPDYARVIREEMRRADAIHVRCPANISLLALWLLGRTDRPAARWVKYAGNWQPETADAWSYGLQRRWLRENRHRGAVTVNGRWLDQPDFVRSFYNPSLTREELAEGAMRAGNRGLTAPMEILFVGELNDGKGAGRALDVARHLTVMGVDYRLQLIGDGPDRPRYEQVASNNDLSGVVFRGWVPRDAIGRYYAGAHMMLLPSRSEGWPKVLSEGMAYGLVPVAGAVSSIPQMLGEIGTGIALSYDDTQGMAEAIARYAADPERWQTESRAGLAAAERFGYDYYQKAVAELFETMWGISLPVAQPEQVAELAGEGGR